MADYVDIIMKWSRGTEQMRNIWTIKVEVAPASVAARAACDVMMTYYLDFLRPIVHSSTTFEGAAYRNVSEVGNPEIPVDSDPWAGQAGGELMPPALSGMLHILSEARGPNFGTKYIPSPSELNNGPGGIPNGDYKAALEALGNAVQNENVAGLLYRWGIARRNSSGVVTAFNEVTSYRASPRWAYLRRRANGR